MEESPDMRRVKEPRPMVAVLIFGVIFMVGFGIWHAPILEFASEAVINVPDLAETMTQISTNSTGTGGSIVNSSGVSLQLRPHLLSSHTQQGLVLTK